MTTADPGYYHLFEECGQASTGGWGMGDLAAGTSLRFRCAARRVFASLVRCDELTSLSYRSRSIFNLRPVLTRYRASLRWRSAKFDSNIKRTN
jgi:hypothetical protein